MHKKRLVITGIAVLTIILAIGGVFAADPMKLIVNKQEIACDTPPKVIQGTLMVPIKAVAESLDVDVNWDEQENAVIITEKEETSKIIADIPEEKITLSAIERDGMYEDFYLEINGRRKFFDWKNVTNPTYGPQLVLSDLNEDGQEELIVILATGTGTGVNVNEAHIINVKTLAKIYMDDPTAIMLKNVKTQVCADKIEITLNNQKQFIGKENVEVAPENWFGEIGFNSIRRFEVVNNTLKANIALQIAPASFIGEVQIHYVFKDNMYQAGKIEFRKEPDQNF